MCGVRLPTVFILKVLKINIKVIVCFYEQVYDFLIMYVKIKVQLNLLIRTHVI